jgi:mRNA interferase RelE/StbE
VSEDEGRRYNVKISDAADKQFKKLEKQQQRQILLKLDKLKDDPRPSGVVKVKGYDNFWRIRQGDFRIGYEIHDGELLVLVLKIGGRGHFYDDL